MPDTTVVSSEEVVGAPPILDETEQRSPLMYAAHFCPEGQDPYTLVQWRKVDVCLKEQPSNEVVFEQKDVEVPSTWSDRAALIVAQKYFYGKEGTPERETSVRQVVGRVTERIFTWAVEQQYFETEDDARAFVNDLMYLLLTQKGAFNSPVWFNLGIDVRQQQVSACFINAIKDDMSSIAALQSVETVIFKQGSGSGVNLSALRSSKERLSGGGIASGPVSFMRGYDAWAGIVKSGGGTRRAAAIRILNADHPDTLEFITCKAEQEHVAQLLIKAGLSSHFDDPKGAYALIRYQNANHSLRVTDEFMTRVVYAMEHPEEEVLWDLHSVLSGEVVERVPVLVLWEKVCQAAWSCGDPGLQFDTTVNRWHTCPSDGSIQASNPCQPDFAPVLTPDGIRTFRDIKVGSIIWSGKQWTAVAKKWRTGVKPVYRYHTRAGIFVGTENHNVISHGNRIEVQDAQTIDISVLDCTIESQQLEARDVLDGLMFGDGHVVHANEGANLYPVLNVGENDQSYFDSEVSPFVNPTPYDHKKHRVEGSTLTPDEFPRTYERKVPTRFFQGSRPTICGFLRGLYSANGSICGGRVTLKATSFYVIEAVQQMLSAVGIRSYYTVNKPKDVEFENGTYTCKQSYDLNITVDRGRFAHMIGFIQPEKTLRLAEACKMVSNKPPKTSYEVVEIEYLGDFPVWDITVKAEEHTYWTGGLLVSNCGEFAFLDDSACNLASLNLMRFRFPDGKLDIDALRHATRVFIMAQEILVDRADYPTPTIKKNSMRYRPLGLGYANLGAYLMSIGLPYDSDDARHIAAEVTSIITAEAYLTSTKLATAKQPFEAYTPNRAAMLHVMQQHLAAAGERDLASTSVWEQVIDQGERWGFRNAQVTLCAPTGTISFMMDCDTTGIEPEMSLYKVKSLVGGGTVVMENRIVEMALEKLTYQSQSRKDILRYLARHKHLDGCPQLLKEHLAVFDCAIPAAGTRVLSPQAHIKMVAAIQPFISGAISKTVNLPHSTTPEQIGEIYVESWKLGIKHVTVYRDNCKKSQPLITAVDVLKDEERPTAVRNKLADHQTNMHRIKFRFNAVKGYILVTPYEDTGMPGEIFVRLSKEGSTIQGLVDGWAQSISYCLQFGVPLEVLVQKFSHTKFEPSGYSGDPDIKFAHSIYDAIVRKLAAVFLKQPMTNGHTPEDDDFASHDDIESAIRDKMSDYDSPPCNDCGAIMQRNGSCYVCPTCGITSGCS